MYKTGYTVVLENVSNKTFSFLTERGRWSSEFPEAKIFNTRTAAQEAADQHKGSRVSPECFQD